MSEFLAAQGATAGRYRYVLAVFALCVSLPGPALSAPILADNRNAAANTAQSAPASLFRSSAPASGGQAANMAVRGLPSGGVAPVRTADVVSAPTRIDSANELREYSKELFVSLRIIASQYTGGGRDEGKVTLAGGSAGSPGGNTVIISDGELVDGGGGGGDQVDGGDGSLPGGGSWDRESGDGSSEQAASNSGGQRPRPASAAPRAGLESFIMGSNSNATIPASSKTANGSQATQPAVTREVRFEYWAEPEGANAPVPSTINIATAATSQSFLHKVLCMIGLVSPEAAGLDQDCDYVVH